MQSKMYHPPIYAQMSKKNLSDAVTAELLDDDRDSTSTDTLSRDYESKRELTMQITSIM